MVPRSLNPQPVPPAEVRVTVLTTQRMSPLMPASFSGEGPGSFIVAACFGIEPVKFRRMALSSGQSSTQSSDISSTRVFLILCNTETRWLNAFCRITLTARLLPCTSFVISAGWRHGNQWLGGSQIGSLSTEKKRQSAGLSAGTTPYGHL